MMKPILWGAVFFGSIAAARAADPAPVAFDPLPILRAYLKIDTSNPPGHEAYAAAFLKTIFEREGIPSEIVEIAPGRADIVARLAHLDCRLLPGEDPHAMIEEIRAALADPSIAIEPLQPVVATSSSRTDTDLFRAIERVAARRAPGIPVVPTLLTSWTESALLRPLGIEAYGFDPLALDEHEAGLSHGDDERVSLENIARGADIIYDIVRDAAK